MPSTEEPKVIVYQATNLINGKRYIGVTKRGLAARVKGHMADAIAGRGHLPHMAIRKYGADKIAFEVLVDFEGDYDLAKIYEIEMIAKHRPEYNIAGGGEGGITHPDTIEKIRRANTGQKRSAEARARMSAAQYRRPPPSAETREKFRLAKLGKKHSPEVVARRAAAGYRPSAETRAKLSASLTGKPPTKGRTGQPVSQETREKIRQTLKQRVWVDTPARAASRARTGASAASEARNTPIECVSDGKVFGSMKATAEFYGFKPTKLSLALRKGWRIGGRSFRRLPKVADTQTPPTVVTIAAG